MKIIKTVLFLTLISFLIFPTVALASWWNPFTWNFSFIFHKTLTPNTSTVKQVNPYSTLPTNSVSDDTKENTNLTSPPKQTSTKGTATSPQNKPSASTQPLNSTLCNGIYYTKCANGNDFVCPSNGGEAYCQPQQQIQQQAPQSAPTQDNTAIELDNKNKAIWALTRTITLYSSLNTYINTNKDILNGIVTDLSTINSTSTPGMINNTNNALIFFIKYENITKQIISNAQSQLSQLQLQPLSYFLNYKVPNDAYKTIDDYPNIESMAVNVHDIYHSQLIQYLSTMNQSTTPTVIIPSAPLISIPHPIHCQPSGINGIVCY